MKKVNDLFDNVYCINLDRRQDRWERVKKLFDDQGVTLTRFSAVDGECLHIPENIPIGWRRDKHHNKFSIACTMSHLELLKQAVEKGEKEILVLEDDAHPCSNFNELFIDYYSQLPPYFNICYVGGNNISNPRRVEENVSLITFTKTTVGYIIRLNYMKEIIPVIEENKWLWVIDEIYITLQRQLDPFYIFNPRLVHQFVSHSDITGEEAAYNSMKDLD